MNCLRRGRWPTLEPARLPEGAPGARQHAFQRDTVDGRHLRDGLALHEMLEDLPLERFQDQLFARGSETSQHLGHAALVIDRDINGHRWRRPVQDSGDTSEMALRSAESARVPI
jgi:hypothetical protein